MPHFYKVDKMSYSRADISEVAQKLNKKLDELEHYIDYERRKNDAASREKLHLQNQVNNLVLQMK